MLTTSTEIIHRIDTRERFDALFQTGPTVTAGALTELKFLLDRHAEQLYFIPPKYAFHFDFYREVLGGTLDNGAFDQRAYNRPDRDYIPGTVTAYDSFVDPETGTRGQVCFSYWPTDKFDTNLLVETHDALRRGLAFLPPDHDIAFRPGGPIQDRLVDEQRTAIAAAGLVVRTNLEISRGLTYIALSLGEAIGRLVVIEPGAAVPTLTRTDVAAFLGDVPADAPPVAAIFTTTVQTYNSHLGIKYRQDDTPYFYKAFGPGEVSALHALAGKYVTVSARADDATITEATAEQAAAYVAKIKPQGTVRLAPELGVDDAATFEQLAAQTVGTDGLWSPRVVAAYGRKTCGVVELAKLHRDGALRSSDENAAQVVAPRFPIGVPANWYTRFIRTAVDSDAQTFADRIAALRTDPRFSDANWKAEALTQLRADMRHSALPERLREKLREQVVQPYLAAHPDSRSARLRSSSPVVEDAGGDQVPSVPTAVASLPNMAGAFDSYTARWPAADHENTIENCLDAMAEALRKVYASVWNDRAIAELTWHNVDLDEASVTMAVLVMPNEDDEIANGVVRVNRDLAGFFSITGETQFGENLVTNPEAGATPDTWIDGNYDVLEGIERQDISYERVSNLHPGDETRPHAFTDREIHAVYDAMRTIRTHFARLDGRADEDYLDECEVKVTATGQVLIKQERRWVD